VSINFPLKIRVYLHLQINMDRSTIIDFYLLNTAENREIKLSIPYTTNRHPNPLSGTGLRSVLLVAALQIATIREGLAVPGTITREFRRTIPVTPSVKI